jgi:hypothetical protein
MSVNNVKPTISCRVDALYPAPHKMGK